MDAGNSQQLTVDNVFVLVVPPPSSPAFTRPSVRWNLSAGSGYYLSKGGACPSHGERRLQRTAALYQGDEELAVNKGVSYLCLIPENMVPLFCAELTFLTARDGV
jgi:hypothetical protein